MRVAYRVFIAAIISVFSIAMLAGTTEAAEKLKIRLAAQATSGQVFQYMAKHKGYLDEEAIDIEMIYINNGTDAFSALSSGKVDVLSTYGDLTPLRIPLVS